MKQLKISWEPNKAVFVEMLVEKYRLKNRFSLWDFFYFPILQVSSCFIYSCEISVSLWNGYALIFVPCW